MSGASVSSFGSAVDPEQARMNAGKDDEMLEDGGASIESFIFGLAYTVAKDKEDTPRKFVVARLALEFLQLWLLVVNPAFGWDMDTGNKAWQIAEIINMKHFMAARGYTFYLAVLYIILISLVANLGLSGWVGWSVQNNRLDHAWPVRVLRWYSGGLFQVLDVAMLNLFLIALDCNYFDVELRGWNTWFPDDAPQCWAMPHMIHAGVAVLCIVLFVALASLDAMARMELNPTSRNWLAMNHSKVEILGFATKAVMAMMCVFVTNWKWLSVCLGVAGLVLVYLYGRWVPHMYEWTNHIRVGSFTCVTYSAICLVFLRFKPDVDLDRKREVQDYVMNVTWALWGGMIPSMLLGVGISYARVWYYTRTVVTKFARAKTGVKAKYIHVFKDAREVEIASRVCRQWVDEETLEPSRVLLAERIIKAGLSELPKSTFMIVMHASFLIEVQSSYQSGYTQLQSAKKNKPTFLDRYAIFIREQQHTQKAGDLVSYVEMMRNYKLVHKVHKDTLMAMRVFWQSLLHSSVSFRALEANVRRIDAHIRATERVYRSVLQRHSTSVKLLRIYTKFLEFVKIDPWNASKWGAEADRLHTIEEERKNNIFSDLGGTGGEEGQPSWVQHMANVDDGKAVIIMNAQCLVQAANQAAHAMLGFGKNELRGRNIAAIIPQPFAEHHDNYVRTYLQTGKGAILDKVSEFVALHKERYVFAVHVRVSKVMGMGQDSIFMGCVEALPPIPGVAKAWVLANGALLSVDSVFTDWFGFKPEDLLGQYINSLVVDPKQLEATFKTAKEAQARVQEMLDLRDARLAQGLPSDADLDDRISVAMAVSWRLPGIRVRHKFSDPIELEVEMSNGGVGSHHFYVLKVRRMTAASHHMVVTDKQGRLHHMTQDLATALGSTVHALQSNGNANAVEALLPEPFAQLHRTFVASTLKGQIPPWSCRSGLIMPLQGMGMDGPVHTPFKIRSMKKKEDKAKDGPGTLHVVSLEQASMAQALDERRLTLLVDATGHVTRVGNAPNTLFGFDPAQLIGKSIASFVDALAPEDGEEEDPAMTAQLMVELARRATLSPGCSWRVGVVMPLDPDIDLEALGELGASMLSAKKVRPAVMAVAVHVGNRRSSAMMLSHMGAGVGGMNAGSKRSSFDGPPPAHGAAGNGSGHRRTSLDVPSGAGGASVRSSGGKRGGTGDDRSSSRHRAGEMAAVPENQLPPSPPLSPAHPASGAASRLGSRPVSRLAAGAESAMPRRSMDKVVLVPGKMLSDEKGGDDMPMATEEELRMVEDAMMAAAASALAGQEDDDGPRGVAEGYDGEEGGAGYNAWGVPATATAAHTRGSLAAAPPAPRGAALGGAHALGEGFEEGGMPLSQDLHAAPGARGAPSAASKITIEIHLWRADLLCGVLEVDTRGKVLNTDTHRLCPPGLVFGCSSEALVAQPIARSLPTLVGKIDTLMRDPSAANVKGALKSRSHHQRHDKLAGPQHLLRTVHQGDGVDLELSVQLVKRAPPAHTYWLVVHPIAPRCGRRDLRDWLQDPEWQAKLDVALANRAVSAHPGAPPSTVTGHSTKMPQPPSQKGLQAPRQRSRFSEDLIHGKTMGGKTEPLRLQSSGLAHVDEDSRGELEVAERDDDDVEAMRPRRSDGGEAEEEEDEEPEEGGLAAKLRARNGIVDPVPPKGAKPGVADPARPSLDLDGLKMPGVVTKAGGAAHGSGSDEVGGSADGQVRAQPADRLQPLILVLEWRTNAAGCNKTVLAHDPVGCWCRALFAPQVMAAVVPRGGPAEPLPGAKVVGLESSVLQSSLYTSADKAAAGGDTALDRVAQWVLTDGAEFPPPGAAAAGKGKAAVGKGHGGSEGSEEEEGSEGHKPGVPPGHPGSNSDASEDNAMQVAAAAAADAEPGAAADNMSEHISEAASALDEAGMVPKGDFRRGTRMKKLLRRLNSQAAQHVMRRFKWHTLALVGGMLVLHVGIFAMMQVLISAQEDEVMDLNQVGTAAQQIGHVAAKVRQLSIFINNHTVPGLTHLEDTEDRDLMLGQLHAFIAKFLGLHSGTYMGFKKQRRIDRAHGLRTLWEEASLPVVRYWPSLPTPIQVNRSAGLWEGGNAFGRAALDVWQNWERVVNATNGTSTPEQPAYDDWAPVKFVLYNGLNVLVNGYYSTLDGVVQLVTDHFKRINSVQLIILGVEGVFVSCAACFYMWILLSHVNNHRFAIYNVFMLIPVGLARGLATRPLGLDDDEDEGDDMTPAVPPDQAAAGGQVQSTDGHTEENGSDAGQPKKPESSGKKLLADTPVNIRISMNPNSVQARNGQRNKLMSFFSRLAFWRPVVNANEGAKRQLQRSHFTTFWLVWPFALWGVTIVVLYAFAYQALSNVSGPIATLNLVNFVAVRYQRVFFYTQELAFLTDPAQKEAVRSTLEARLALMTKEYNAMLYGAQAVPEETSPHFTLATEGLAFVAGQGSDILYNTRDCLRANQTECLTTESPYYEYTRNGLDMLMKHFYENVKLMIKANGSEPRLSGPEFEYIWLTRPDVQGGLDRLGDAYSQHVRKLYNTSLMVHIVCLVITTLILIGYVLFMLRPFLHAANSETRRVVELLSQLPPDINVEDLVSRGILQLRNSGEGNKSGIFASMKSGNMSSRSFTSEA